MFSFSFFFFFFLLLLFFVAGTSVVGAQLGRLGVAVQVSTQSMRFFGEGWAGVALDYHRIPTLSCSSDFGVHLVSI